MALRARHWKTLVGFGFVGLLIGGILGLALGLLIPDYYIGVFGLPPSRRGDAPSMGLGLGISQGLLFGVLAGIVFVALDLFRSRPSQEERPSSSKSPPLSRALVITIVSNLILTLAIVCGLVALGILRLISTTGRTPDTTWSGNEIYIHNISRETLIVTHLAIGLGPRGHVGAYAALDPPLLLTMKGRPKVDPRTMRWQEPNGEVTGPPEPGTPVIALFVVPEQTTYSSDKR